MNSQEKYGFQHITVLPTKCKASAKAYEAIGNCNDLVKEFEKAWFSRSQCKSVTITQKVSVLTFALWNAMENNERDEILKRISEIIDLDIIKNIRIPKSYTEKEREDLESAKLKFEDNIQILQNYYYYHLE